MATFRLSVELHCAHFFSRLRGLMFRWHPKTALFIPSSLQRRNAIPLAVHTFFVFFSIDVYWLDEQRRITHRETLSPFSFSGAHPAQFLVETKHGLLSARVGDVVEFSECGKE